MVRARSDIWFQNGSFASAVNWKILSITRDEWGGATLMLVQGLVKCGMVLDALASTCNSLHCNDYKYDMKLSEDQERFLISSIDDGQFVEQNERVS